MALAQSIRITILTADTFGHAESQLAGLPVQVRIVQDGAAKAEILKRLGPESAIAIGNGRNDVSMMARAGLGIAVLGPEGAAIELWRAADIAVADITESHWPSNVLAGAVIGIYAGRRYWSTPPRARRTWRLRFRDCRTVLNAPPVRRRRMFPPAN